MSAICVAKYVVSMQVTDQYNKEGPILLRKEDVKVALYGLSNVKKGRLHTGCSATITWSLRLPQKTPPPGAT